MVSDFFFFAPFEGKRLMLFDEVLVAKGNLEGGNFCSNVGDMESI